MKTGIVTPVNHNYTRMLIYFLIHCSLKPDYVIFLKSSFYKRIIRNFNFSMINRLFNHEEKTPETSAKDYLKEFLNEKRIDIPDLSLTEICRKEKIKFLMAENINSVEVINFIKEENIDLLINAGGGIYRKEIIQSLKTGILNAHMGSLPDFRGMNVLEWSLFYKKDIGVTLHFIDSGIDTGDTLLFTKLNIEENDNIDKLRNKSAVVNFQLLLEGITGIKNGTLKRQKQVAKVNRQYFVMHPRLKFIAEKNIKSYLDN